MNTITVSYSALWKGAAHNYSFILREFIKSYKTKEWVFFP